MDYKQVKELINQTLQGKERGHEITPMEHQNMILSVLDYIQQTQVTAQSIFQGYANSETYPETPNNGRLCYMALCKNDSDSSEEITFTNFDGYDGNPISVTCTAGEIKIVLFLWNRVYFEKMERSSVYGLNGDFNIDFNNDFFVND